MPPAASAVLDFWFGAPGSDAYGRQHKRWFIKRDETDTQIRERFGAWVAQALAGGLTDWDATARGRLARIVLLDQFPRNIHRGTPGAFAGDAMALAAAQALIDRDEHLHLIPVERIFAYLPLEHAEDAALQARSVALFQALADAHPEFQSSLDYALRHQAVIERFGRFPHRNRLLGRPDTPAEQAYLAEPGSGF